MPLSPGKSKKAFEHNFKAEMAEGKPKDQSLAIAYSMKRKKYAKGGMANESAASESRPMPSETDKDGSMVSRNSGNKSPHNDSWTDRPEMKQSRKGMKTTAIKHPKMVPSSAFSTRLRAEEDDLQESAGVNDGPQRELPEHDNEERPDRKGPDVRDMEREHSNGRKPYAKGGKVSFSEAEEDNEEHPAGLEDENDMMGPDEDEFMASHFAEGGMIDEERDIMDAASIAAACMAKLHKYARGGEILSEDSMESDDSDQVDLSRNADEDANMEDKASFDALRKENYSESDGLNELDYDAENIGDEREASSENDHDEDMVDSIRRKMKNRSAISR